MRGGWLGDIMIIRAEHKNNFMVIQNQLANDVRLSFEARGFMLYLLALPDDWVFSIKGLAQMTETSERTIMRLVKELKQAGYIEQIKKQDERGQFVGYQWFVYEAPELRENRTTAKPNYGKTELRANRSAGAPNYGKRAPILNTNNNQILNIQNNISSKEKSVKEKTVKKSESLDSILETLTPDIRETFVEFIKMRKAIKAPLTARALTLAIKKAYDLGGGDDAKVKAIVEQSIINSWRGLFPLKDPIKAHTAPLQGGETQLERLTRLAVERAEGGNI